MGQLRESGITFHDNPTNIALMKDGKTIAHARRSRNLFILDLATPGKIMKVNHDVITLKHTYQTMALRGRGRATHLVSKNRRIRIWHRRLGHASNARVIRAAALVNGIDLYGAKYDPSEVFVDSEESEHDTSEEDNTAEDVNVVDESEQHDTDTAVAALTFQTSAIDPALDSTLETSAIDPDLEKLCTTCVASKSTRTVKRHKSMTPASEKLEEVHADLWGPHEPPSRSGNVYAAILMCERTRKTWILYLRSKDEFIDAFQTWLPRVEAESGCKMKALRADGGGEFISTKLKEFCEKQGINIKYATPYLHEENGLAERGWRTLVTMKDSLLIDSGLPNDFWAEAMETSNYLRNRLPTKSRGHGELIPEEEWTNRKQNLSHVRIFGSLVLVDIPHEKRSKSDFRKAWEGILIGYSPDTTKHFRVWAPQTRQVIIASEPHIDETEQGAKLLIQWPVETVANANTKKRKAPAGEPKPRGRPRKVIPPEIVQDRREPTLEQVNTNDDTEATTLQELAMSISEASSKIHEPTSYEEAISDLIHGRQWKDAVEEELYNLESHHTWEFEELPQDRKPIGSKWVFKVKYNPDGSVARFKARLVAQGFSQVPGIDFTETFAPTVRRESLRIYLAICALLGLIIHQVDIVGAYLESLLDDNEFPIYMKPPPGIERMRKGLYCRLLRSLYGLKQSGRLWNQNVIAFYKRIGFRPLNADPSILILQRGKEITIVSIYVDDFLLASNSMPALENLKESLAIEYEMKDLGEVKTIIGWQITRDLATRTIKVSQSAYIRDLLEEENLTDCNAPTIPMKAGSSIEMSEPDDYDEADLGDYQRLIGKLMYLACGTRPDIAFVVGRLSKHNADPRKGHLRAAKRVVRYLKGTIHLELVYGQRPDGSSPTVPAPYGLIGYGDSNFAGDPEDRKSVMGYCFFLNGGVVSWSSKKQRTVSTSTTEAEYIAIGHAAREGIWIKRFINELQLEITGLSLKGDNEASLNLTKNPESQHRTKHIDVQHHYVRELVNDKELKIEWVPSAMMLADGMTKALTIDLFKKHRALLGLVQ